MADTALNEISENTGFGATIWNAFVRMGMVSTAASSAKTFAALSELSDEELAKRDLKREDLMFHCFGARGYC